MYQQSRLGAALLFSEPVECDVKQSAGGGQSQEGLVVLYYHNQALLINAYENINYKLFLHCKLHCNLWFGSTVPSISNTLLHLFGFGFT